MRKILYILSILSLATISAFAALIYIESTSTNKHENIIPIEAPKDSQIDENSDTYSLVADQQDNLIEAKKPSVKKGGQEISKINDEQALGVTVTEPNTNSNYPIQDKTKEESEDARHLFKPLTGKKEKNSNQGNIPGIRIGADPILPTSPSPSPSPSPSKELPWAFGQARGYAMLYAMQPEARAVVEQQVQNLIDSRIRQLSISVLIDGTFNKDFSYLKNIIQRLSGDKERSLILALYLSNGPTMRKWDETPIRTDFSQYEPSEFRRRIMWDERVKAQFQINIDQAVDLFKFNNQVNPNNKNIAFAMLEDNLDRDSYFLMRQQVLAGIGNLATFMRNPCEGCYEGNNSDPLGNHVEEHHLNFFGKLGQFDSFTFDGIGFQYPESKNQSNVSWEQAQAVMNIGLQRGLSYIGLWQSKWQGLPDGNTRIHPKERPYELSSKIELEHERELLREGLSLESEEEE